MFLMGCNVHMHPYADYLQQAVGRDDHDTLAKKMGAPHRTVALDKGGDLWTYDYCPSGQYLGSPQCEQDPVPPWLYRRLHSGAYP